MKQTKFTTISIKKDKNYEEFIKNCEKIGMKKGDVLKALIAMFNENPQVILKQILK